MQENLLPSQGQRLLKFHCLLIHLFFCLMVLRQTQNSGQCGISDLIVQTDFYIIKYGLVFKQTDILECTGNPCFVDIDRLFSL